MGEKSIKKETKKPKKSDKALSSSSASAPRPVMTQPELIKKEKKFK